MLASQQNGWVDRYIIYIYIDKNPICLCFHKSFRFSNFNLPIKRNKDGTEERDKPKYKTRILYSDRKRDMVVFLLNGCLRHRFEEAVGHY